MPRARKKPSTPAITAAKVHGLSPATIRRMRDAISASVSDARLGHELGRLALRELQDPGSGITTAQESAGLRYADLRSRWRAVTGVHPATVRAQDIGRVRGSVGETDAGRAEAVEAAMREADGALEAASKRCRRAVEIVCDRDCIVAGHEMLIDLRAGLDALARFWGIVR